eukprot:SAG31_NODE_1025_length_10289_cov_3.290677_10_plen_154_part_00
MRDGRNAIKLPDVCPRAPPRAARSGDPARDIPHHPTPVPELLLKLPPPSTYGASWSLHVEPLLRSVTPKRCPALSSCGAVARGGAKPSGRPRPTLCYFLIFFAIIVVFFRDVRTAVRAGRPSTHALRCAPQRAGCLRAGPQPKISRNISKYDI